LNAGEGGWEVIGPSPVPFAESYQVPNPLTERDIAEIRDAFARAAARANRASAFWRSTGPMGT
jgi:anthraniloyl-CoA monooxygenase